MTWPRDIFTRRYLEWRRMGKTVSEARRLAEFVRPMFFDQPGYGEQEWRRAKSRANLRRWLDRVYGERQEKHQ